MVDLTVGPESIDEPVQGSRLARYWVAWTVIRSRLGGLIRVGPTKVRLRWGFAFDAGWASKASLGP